MSVVVNLITPVLFLREPRQVFHLSGLSNVCHC